jgi:hypothetical protein
MRMKSRKLEWHPDNLSLAQIVEILQAEGDESITNSDDQQRLVVEATAVMNQYFVHPVDNAKAEDIWQWFTRFPLQANIVLATVLVDTPHLFDRTVSLHTWHR